MARILIIGASRGIGLEAVKLGLARGYRVRAFARSAERMSISHPSLEKHPGDARDFSDVSNALGGIEAVIQALGVPTGPDMVFNPTSLFSDATRVLLRAMVDAGVKRLISVTGFGAGDSRQRLGCVQGRVFRILLGRAYDDKDIQESLIRDSDLDWVITRPVILTRGPRTGRYRVLLDPERWRNGLISRADVADFLIRQVNSDENLRRTPVLLSCPL